MMRVREGGALRNPWEPLWVRPEERFRAGCIADAAWFWTEYLLPEAELSHSEVMELRENLHCGIDVGRYFRHYTGEVKGVLCDSAMPPVLEERNKRLSLEDKTFIDAEVPRLEAIGAVRRALVKPRVVMPIGVARNSAGKPRQIYDARCLNMFTQPDELHYDSLRIFHRGLAAGDYLITLDHKSGYHHWPVADDSRTYLGFQWRGVYYEWCVMPFGWSPACAIYNTASTVVAAFLRRSGVHTMVYLDDFGFGQPGDKQQEALYRTLWLIMAVMYLAGYVVSLTKSQLIPRRIAVMLGFGVDTVAQRFFVPQDKLARIMELLKEAGTKPAMKLQELRSLVGKLQALSLAVPCVSVYLVRAYRVIAEATRANARSVKLTPGLLEDLADLRCLEQWTGLSKWRSETHVRFETDASGAHGWGAVIWLPDGVVTVKGMFSEEEMGLDIMVKEAYTVVLALEAPEVYGRVTNCFLDLFTDNEIVRFTLLRGSVHYDLMRDIARRLVDWQIRNNVVIRTFRVSTKDNIVADTLSRSGMSGPGPRAFQDVGISDVLFERVSSLARQPFTIDLCASASSARCSRYVVPPGSADPMALMENAFLWAPKAGANEYVYCFPPFQLVSPMWRHLRLIGARGVFVVPNSPKEQWYGAVVASALEVHRLACLGVGQNECVLTIFGVDGCRTEMQCPPGGLLVAVFDFVGLSSYSPQ